MKKSANPVCSQCGDEPLSSAAAADLQQKLLKKKQQQKNSYYGAYELLVFRIIIYLI